jgi:hypothetical protein
MAQACLGTQSRQRKALELLVHGAWYKNWLNVKRHPEFLKVPRFRGMEEDVP